MTSTSPIQSPEPRHGFAIGMRGTLVAGHDPDEYEWLLLPLGETQWATLPKVRSPIVSIHDTFEDAVTHLGEQVDRTAARMTGEAAVSSPMPLPPAVALTTVSPARPEH